MLFRLAIKKLFDGETRQPPLLIRSLIRMHWIHRLLQTIPSLLLIIGAPIDSSYKAELVLVNVI